MIISIDWQNSKIEILKEHFSSFKFRKKFTVKVIHQWHVEIEIAGVSNRINTVAKSSFDWTVRRSVSSPVHSTYLSPKIVSLPTFAELRWRWKSMYDYTLQHPVFQVTTMMKSCMNYDFNAVPVSALDRRESVGIKNERKRVRSSFWIIIPCI